ncbi:MAG: DUF58 domain-containing protein [Actinomycetota bacterium]|nr:DUF58 domain-containing protein [Actinomycetota bacterium]
MSLTGRSVAVAALGVVAAGFLGGRGIALVFAVLLVGVVVDLVLAGRIRDLALSRSGATQTRLGVPVTVALIVANTGSRRVRGQLRDAWVPSAGASPRRIKIDVPPGERRRFEIHLLPTRRGDRQTVHLTVRSVGPLGLAARQRRHARRVDGRRQQTAPWAVRVLPPFTSRKFLPEKLARLRQLDGAVAINRRGQGTEFDSLRDYVDGDDVRSIDWRATARRDTVVVRTWRPERDRRLVCVLDTGRTSAARVGDAPRLDATLDACLLLAAVAARAGDRVDLLAADRRVRASVEAATRGEVLPRLVQAMANLEPSLVETDATLLVSEVLRRERKRCLVVLFTALDGAAIDEGLLPVLPSLTSRHIVILASVGDPRVAELAGRRGDAQAVYEAAAAERTLGERQRVTAVLRRRGVEVVDAPPETFASVVADAYLALKAAGRL